MKTVKWIDLHFEELFLAIFLMVITLDTGLQVFMRYIMNNSLSWSEELSRFCFVWSGFFSLGYCIKHNIEIKIDMFTGYLPVKIQTGIDLLSMIIEIGLFSCLLSGSVKVVQDAIFTNQLSPAMEIPMVYVQALCTIGLGIGILRAIQKIIVDIKFLAGKNDTKEIKGGNS